MPDRPAEIREVALRTGMLPLVLGIGGWTLLRPTGGIVHGTEWNDALRLEEDVGKQVGAIVFASRWYPELMPYVPKYTSSASPCGTCQRLKEKYNAEWPPNIICAECGGLRWVDLVAFREALAPLLEP
jgi:hypothetical protein